MTLRLLIADPSPQDCDTATDLLAALGFCVAVSRSPLEALARCESALPDVLIVDSSLADALDLIGSARLMAGNRPVRILYGVAEADLRALMAAKHAGADDFLLKPYESKVLHALFDEALARAVAAA
jgi:two-component system chemotaxis response regulator CheY